MATTRTLEPAKGQPIEHTEHVHVSDKLDPGAAKTGARNVALAEALAIENARPFRKSFIKLYMCLFVAYMCSSTNGFDANTFGGLSAEPNFAKFFNLTPANNGAVVVLYVVGQLTACLFAGQLSDMFGRRFGMALGALICVIGAVVQAASQSRPDLMGGRYILGLGSVICNASGPAYVVEMAYPKYRGFQTGLYQAMFFCGTISTTWLEYGLSYLPADSELAWRLPLAMQTVPSLILLACVYFIPETPRWWMARDRADKAKEILVKYHGDGNENSAIVALEMQEMLLVVSKTGSDKRWWDFRDLFNTPGARYRTLLVVAVAWFSEIELPPTSYYLPLMVATVGITSLKTKLLLNALQTPIMMIASLSGLCLIDRFNRRTLLMIGSTLMTCSMAIITACTAEHAVSKAVSGTGIAFLYIFLVAFAFCWVPNQALYPSEVLAYNTRAKGLAFYNLVRSIVLIINTYVPPIAIASVSWRFYIFYIVFDACGVLVVYLIFVETRGWSLEEIEAIFNSKNPKKASLAKHTADVFEETTPVVGRA